MLPVSNLMAQHVVVTEGDSISQEIVTDSLAQIQNVPEEKVLSSPVTQNIEAVREVESGKQKEQVEFKPDPKRAVIYSAIFPGLGQIYNRKYWKLPIIYGGFIGCAYSITWNSTQYNDYKQAYSDIVDNDPNTDSWKNMIRYGINPDELTPSQISSYADAFKNKKDYYRRYRDLSYIITVGVYALCMLDAYVDAQLFDFDISPDLSMRMEPVIFDKSAFASRSFGLQCSINF